MTGDLAAQVGELRRRQESHREAQAALGRAEHEALNQLMAAVRAPELRAGRAVRHGRMVPHARAAETSRPGPARRGGAGYPGTIAEPAAPALLPRREERPPGLGLARRVSRRASTGASRAIQRAGPGRPLARRRRRTACLSRHGGPGRGHGRQGQAAPELAVHLLGPLHVAIDDVAVEDWPSARCRSLFGYLLTHREPWPPTRGAHGGVLA